MDTLMSIKDFLARAGISKATLRRLWIDGKGPERVRIGKRSAKVPLRAGSRA